MHPNKTPLGSSLWLGGVPHFIIFVFPGPPYGNGYPMSCWRRDVRRSGRAGTSTPYNDVTTQSHIHPQIVPPAIERAEVPQC